jgi:hypothetical protein
MIALVGSKLVGKSSYIAVLINELLTSVGKEFDAALNALDEQTRRRYDLDFRRPLYQTKAEIGVTKSVLETRYPLVYRWTRKTRRRLWRTSSDTCCLAFFDHAGEDLPDFKRISTVAKYIAHADGLIFLLDPLQVPRIRESSTVGFGYLKLGFIRYKPSPSLHN